MNGLIATAGLILVVVQYGSFNPDPLNDLTINFNIKDSSRAFGDKEFEADNDEPHPVVIGGVTSNDEPLKDLEIFDGEWKPFPPDVPHVIHRTAAVTFENKIYFVGGINAPNTAVQYNGEFYVIGGRGVQGQSVNGMRSIEVFKDGKWKFFNGKNTRKKIMKQKRMGHGAEVVDNLIVVCGGKYRERFNTQMKYLRSCETFNGNQWDDNNIGDMNHIRSNFGFMFYNGQLWAFGGYNNGQVLSSVEFCVNDGQTPIPIWRLEHPENFLKKPRAYFGVAKYNPLQPQPSKKRRLEQANIVNSTFV